jgi:hypothetical protein
MAVDGEHTMSDPQASLPSPATVAQAFRQIVRWLMLAAFLGVIVMMIVPSLFALPLVLVPLGLFLLVGLALVASGKAPPAWLSCIDPKDVGKLGGTLRPILLIIVGLLVAILLGLPGLVIVLITVVVLFGLGWSGIGPLAPLVTILRGIVALVRLLPTLRTPVGLAADALGAASDAVTDLSTGLQAAENKLGETRAALTVFPVPTLDPEPDKQTVNVPGIGHFDVPGWKMNRGTSTPFGAIADLLGDVQTGLDQTRTAAIKQHDALKSAAEALRMLEALLPPQP